MEEILDKDELIDNKFRLAILAAKRAKQIINGSKKKIDINAENPLTIALEEIYQGEIDFDTLEESYEELEEQEVNKDEESEGEEGKEDQEEEDQEEKQEIEN